MRGNCGQCLERMGSQYLLIDRERNVARCATPAPSARRFTLLDVRIFSDQHEAIGVGERQRAKPDGVHDAEGARARSDGERQ